MYYTIFNFKIKMVLVDSSITGFAQESSNHGECFAEFFVALCVGIVLLELYLLLRVPYRQQTCRFCKATP